MRWDEGVAHWYDRTSIKARSETFSLFSVLIEDEDGGNGERLGKIVDKRWSTLSRHTTPCRLLNHRGGNVLVQSRDESKAKKATFRSAQSVEGESLLSPAFKLHCSLKRCSYPQTLPRQPRPLYSVRNLPKRHLSREIRPLMLRLHINTKRAKPTIVRCAQLIFRDVFRRLNQLLTNLVCGFHVGRKRVSDADESDLFDHAVGAVFFSDVLADGLVDGGFVGLGGALDEEVAGVDGEEGGEEGRVGDVVGVDAVAVTAGAGVDADVRSFEGAKFGEDSGFEVSGMV